jgi:hypothetical protein
LSFPESDWLILVDSVSTGYGQPPGTIYDWAIEPASLKVADYRIPEEIRIRLRIEKFCDRVTKGLYSSKPDPSDFATAEKLLIVRILEGELKEMELEFGQEISRRKPSVNCLGTVLTNSL